MRSFFRNLAASFLICLAGTAVAAPADKDQWTRCSNEGQRLAPEIVIAGCTALIDSGNLSPKNLGTAHYNRGTAYSDRGDYAKAIADLDEAIRLDPKDSQAFVNRGVAYARQEDYARAIADYDAAIRLDPGNGAAWFARGNAYAYREEEGPAIVNYSEAIRLNPQDSDAYYNRALALRRQGENDRAIADYDEAIRLQPSSDAFNNRGYIYFMKGDLARAVAGYVEAVRLDPRNVEAQANLCQAATLVGEDLVRARAACDAVLAIRPDHLLSLARRGIVSLKQGRFQDAWNDFDAALGKDADSGAALFGRGIAALRLGRSGEGNADIERAARLVPGIAEDYARYGLKP